MIKIEEKERNKCEWCRVCKPAVGTQVDEEYLDAVHDVEVDEERDLGEEEDDGDDEEDADNKQRICNDNDRRINYTGMFHDCMRRTDYVLVINDDSPRLDPFMREFLLGLVRLGLQLEFQKGQLEKNENLLFVKIHAPDWVLDEFCEPFGMKVFFKDTHLQHIGCNLFGDEKFVTNNEREWMKLVRDSYIQPLKYSNYERSTIVYMLLRHMPFDPQRNHVGIQRLLNRKIILDAYALHDGPYFFVEGQICDRINARQVLNYSWIGPYNIIQYQTRHLITEYLGPKIGFFFTYYEFYNKFLFVLSWAGLVTFILQLVDRKYLYYDAAIKDICGSNSIHKLWCPLCPNSQLCHFETSSYYCADAAWGSFYDNFYSVFYCIFLFLWAAIFYVCWRRQESFYIWIWEQQYRNIHHSTPAIRPEYRANFGQFGWKDKDGRWSSREKWQYRFLSYAAGRVPALAIIMVGFIIYYKYYVLHLEWPGLYKVNDTTVKGHFVITSTHKILALLTALFYLLLFALELLSRLLLRATLMVENNRLQSAHERRQAVQMFSLACLSCFPIPMYFGIIRGAFYTFPRKETDDLMMNLLGYNITYRFYNTVIFDLVVVILTALRIVLWRGVPFWSSCWNTDFSMSPQRLASVPSWERESALKPVTDVQIDEYYNEIVLQFAIVVLLSPWFPLMPLIAFLVNWCDIKHKANLILKYSRRPTLFPTEGILQWNTILKGIVIVIPIVHAITIVRHLRGSMIKLYSILGSSMPYNKTMISSHIPVSDLAVGWPAHVKGYDHCWNEGNWPSTKEIWWKVLRNTSFPNQRRNIVDNLTDADNQIITEPGRTEFHKRLFDVAFVIGYSYLGILIFLVILYFVPLGIPLVFRYVQVEKALKKLFVLSQIKMPEDHLKQTITNKQLPKSMVHY